ncbi:MAG: polyphenol oxidase family protein, partial [Nostoc sp.]
LASADGLISEQPLQAVWVASADCTPVLIGDVKTEQVAALHAGWRGTAKKIVPLAIARLQSQGSKLDDLRIAMGPAIAGEVYQVSIDVAAEVG